MRTTLLLLFLSAPFLLQAQTYTSVSSGLQFGVALRSDSSVWVWGYNANGQLGNGGTATTPTPVRVDVGRKWIAVAAGGLHRLSIASDSTLWACGLNGNGQLGLPANLSPNPVMVQIGTQRWKYVTAGLANSAAISIDGSLWVAGMNNFGVLGTGDTTVRTGFVRIGTETDWRSVSIGYDHILAIKNDNTLWAWGSNSRGQLGTGTGIPVQLTPVQVGAAADWASVSAGYDYSIALKTDGSLHTTGINKLRQLGRATTGVYDSVFAPVGTQRNWTYISAGGMHALAINDSGRLHAWGANSYGQTGLAQATQPVIAAPSIASSDAGWARASAAIGFLTLGGDMYGTFSVAIKADAKALCTSGSNMYGELGLGRTFNYQDNFGCNAGRIGMTEVAGTRKQGTVRVFPVPCTDRFHVDISSAQIESATVFSLEGKLMGKTSGKGSGLDIHCAGYPAGFYMLHILSTEGDRHVMKVQKI